MKKTKGFSLIELLVVISIMAVLMTLSLISIQGVRKSSRDAKRKADLQMISAGLELYKADCGTYPPEASVVVGSSLTGDGSPASCDGTYVETIPDDPISGYNYDYELGTGSLTYTLCAALETTTTLDARCNTAGASCGTGDCSHSVKNP